MKISYSWLKDYIKTNEPPEEISAILTSIGLEVESIETVEAIKGGLKGVVIGHVMSCEKHLEADRLSVTKVDVGTGELLQIVCGAPNVAAGQKVAVATIGTTLYFSSGDEVKIKKSKLRGVESQGMICAEDELGLSSDHDGIMVLNADAQVGMPADEYFQIENEYVFEIGLTANHIDAASHIGVARDLAAYFKSKKIDVGFTYPSVENFKIDSSSNPYSISVENTEACPRYTGITISNVKVAPSPEWLQKKLKTIGLAPRNNVVDITNFVLHELGQPLHAFDADKIDGKNVRVRTFPEGTSFTTLDEKERKLSDQDLMISSETKPMCIAGVFGGISSGITDSTTNVFLESAYFNPVWIRKTARRHGLHTDASFRYERGADPNITVYALKRATMLIKELTGGEISSEIVDIYPTPIKPSIIDVDYQRIFRFIGKDIGIETVKTILKALEFSIEKESAEGITVSVPAYRVDVKIEADVVEEILRIYSYNNIEIPSQVRSSLSYQPKPDKDRLINMVSDFLSANGFHEAMSNSLTKSSYFENIEIFPTSNLVCIVNPLSNDLNVLRPTLIFSGLEAIAYNINRRNSNLRLYEFGNIYKLNPEKDVAKLEAYSEDYHLSIFVTGTEGILSWNSKPAEQTFFHLKGVVEMLLERFGLNLETIAEEPVSSLYLSDGLAYKLNGKTLVEMGVVTKSAKDQLDIKQDVYAATIYWSVFVSFIKKHSVKYHELPKYPEVKRDLALVVDKAVSYSDLYRIAIKTEKPPLKKVSLFDVYEGKNLPEGKKQYALSFTLRDDSKTLTDKQVEVIMDKLLKAFEKNAGALLR
ncbi:MAG: phenylalanine--tRNA ligase subunit beta [Prevotellaceae bacterium]|jgi:phenylalanyl-tRNA synthetase beta chain|nr:phenylalanine--tRNA ligase subunit beta [Prevotellaceae bacterium]